MPTVEGYTASICSGGLPLEEFQVEYGRKSDETVCWIAPQAGAAFSIQVSRKKRPLKDWYLSLNIDSQELALKHGLVEKEVSNRTCSQVRSYDDQMGKTLCPLYFSKRSEVCVEEHSVGSKAAGTIEVVIYEGAMGLDAKVNATTTVRRAGIIAAAGEKQSKGADLSVSLGRGSPSGQSSCSFRFTFDYERRIAKFTFKYRSLAVLQAFDIAPRPRLPTPSPVADAERRQQRRTRLRREAAKATKAVEALSQQLKQLDDEELCDDRPVKKEAEALKRQAQRGKLGIDVDNPRKRKIEVVDLTLNDD